MPPKAFKTLEKLRKSKSGWRSKDLRKLYEGFGFIVRSGTNHDIVEHPEYPQLRDTLPRHAKELATGYAKDALKNIEELLELQAKEESDEGDNE